MSALMLLLSLTVIPALGQNIRTGAGVLKIRNKASYVLQVPFDLGMTTKGEFDMLTLIDADNDGVKWRFNSKALASPYMKGEHDLDDWAILPGAIFTKTDNNYELSFNMWSNMASPFHSEMEVWIGTEPTVEGMKVKIGAIDNFINNIGRDDTVRQKFNFGVPGEAGTYYIGFRCTTKYDDDSWTFWMNNISVKELETSAAAPANVVDAVITPAEKGGLKANVKFNMPLVDMGNKSLPKDKPLTAIITSPAETKTISKLPGEAVDEDIATVQGANKITIQVNNDIEGEAMSYDTYTGEVLPMRVHNLKGVLSRDNLKYTLTWNRPTEGKDGGYVDFDNLEYDVYLYDTEKQDYVYHATSGKDSTYVYELAEGDPLQSVRIGIFARSAAGVSDDRFNWKFEDPVFVSDIIGTPYELPVLEEFNDLQPKYSPIRIQYPNDDYAGGWKIQDPSEMCPDENHSALVGYNPLREDATMGRVAIAKFSTLGKTSMAFSVRLLRYLTYSSTMDFYVRDYDTDPENLTKLGTVICNEGKETVWADYTFPIPEKFMNKEWIQIIVDAKYDEVNYMYAIDRYSISQTAERDLAAVNITGANAVEVGSKAEYTAEVYNVGTKSLAAEGMFEVVSGNNVVTTESVAATTVESGDKQQFKYSYSPTADEFGKDVEIRFVLTNMDEVADNDTVGMKVDVRRPDAPLITDLKAENNEGIRLSWSQPALNKSITESFEDEEAFSYGDDLAGFTNFDGDGKDVFKFSSVTMPNEAKPKAFMVLKPSELTGGEGLEPHTGSQLLMAVCPDTYYGDYEANDWLITPELKGGCVFSFWMNILSATYPETVKVMYSSTTSEPSEFTELESILKVNTGWQKYEYILPEDAKYAAINYVSLDMFGILVDDVKFVSATELHAVSGYKVYRDNSEIGETTATEFTDVEAQSGKSYKYNVTVISDGIESPKSNTATVDYTTSIEGLGIKAKPTVSSTYRYDGTRIPTLRKGVNIQRMSDGSVRKKVVR